MWQDGPEPQCMTPDPETILDFGNKKILTFQKTFFFVRKETIFLFCKVSIFFSWKRMFFLQNVQKNKSASFQNPAIPHVLGYRGRGDNNNSVPASPHFLRCRGERGGVVVWKIQIQIQIQYVECVGGKRLGVWGSGNTPIQIEKGTCKLYGSGTGYISHIRYNRLYLYIICCKLYIRGKAPSEP